MNTLDLFVPTDAPAGSAAKVDVLGLRAYLRLPLWHPDDNLERLPFQGKDRLGQGTFREAVLNVLRKHGGLTSRELREYLSEEGIKIGNDQLLQRLNGYARDGRIVKSGGRGSSYYCKRIYRLPLTQAG
jgi:hypothetical protein